MNKVFLIGNLTADPIAQTFDSGSTVCRFTIAVSRYSKNKDEQADFISIVVWNQLAQNCSKYLSKGKKVAVAGSIQTGSYEKDGQKRYTVDVRADQVEFLSKSDDGGGNFGGGERKRTESIDSLQEIGDGVDDDMPF